MRQANLLLVNSGVCVGDIAVGRDVLGGEFIGTVLNVCGRGIAGYIVFLSDPRADRGSYLVTLDSIRLA